MLDVFLKTLPFFGLIGLGYAAARSRFFANLRFDEIFEPRLAAAYLWGTAFTWGIGMMVAFLRGLDLSTASIEAQCGAIGNTGFLGVPMLALLLGQEAVGPIILILSIDLIVFSSLLTLMVTGARQGRMHL